MNDDDRLDLSPLAPDADGAAWDALLARTLSRVDAALGRRGQQDPLTLIAGWTRSIVMSAGLMVLILIPVEFALEERESVIAQAERLAQLSAHVVRSERGASGEEVFRALDPQAAQ